MLVPKVALGDRILAVCAVEKLDPSVSALGHATDETIPVLDSFWQLKVSRLQGEGMSALSIP